VPLDALTRIRARGHIGIRLGLGRMQALLSQLGDPQAALRGVLVAGTNGKGSAAAMVASVVGAAGHSTGQSPSPHLHSYRERVTIDGRPVGPDELETLLEDVLRASETGTAEFGPATEFELLTAAAYLGCARAGVEVMVMEVGLGGRLDASNTWHPDVAAITNVGLDHQDYLGDTLTAVAIEKAAIIKPGSRAVTGATGEALVAISDRARKLGVPLTVCSAIPVTAMDLAGITLEHAQLGVLRLPLVGRHQAANAAVALGVIDALAQADVAVTSDEDIRQGLATVHWPGRLELIEHAHVTILLDGAHNPDGMSVLAATADELSPQLPSGRATLLAGVMRDKDVAGMLQALSRPAIIRDAHFVATTVPDSERAMPAVDLARAWLDVTGGTAQAVADPGQALDRALAVAAREGGPLIIAGSLYLVGHLRSRLVPDAPRDERV
jgi:dihydrofolate synthase/folylpolyglutamate synthase